MASLPEVALVLAIFMLMIAGLMEGLFTPTEAGSVGTMALLLLVFFRRQLNLKGYAKAVGDSARTACMILMLIGSFHGPRSFHCRDRHPSDHGDLDHCTSDPSGT